MPEGPEIRLAADKLAKVLSGRVPEQLDLLLPGLERHAGKLQGKRILSVQPRSKAMLIHFDGGHWLYSHNQLYGRWYVVRAGKVPRTQRSLRVAIHMRDHSAFLYSASDIEVLNAAQLQQHPYLSKLGPDLLDPQTTRDIVRQQAQDARFARRRLSSLLLDQAFFAGLGNYLRSEILYLAALSHDATLRDLDAHAPRRLADTALAVTLQAYRCRGVTNDLERVARLKAEGYTYSQYRHHVFAREGLDCWACGATISRVDVSGRAIFFCPDCQPSLSGR